MSIQVSCPCGMKVRAGIKAAGSRLSCPRCGEPIDIPTFVPSIPKIPTGAAESKSVAGTRIKWIFVAVCGLFVLGGLATTWSRRDSPKEAPVKPAVAVDVLRVPDPPAKTEAFTKFWKAASAEQQIAMADGREMVPVTDPRVAKARELLVQADALYAESFIEIADMSMKCWFDLNNVGIRSSPAGILEGAFQWQSPNYFQHGVDREYAEYIKCYVMARAKMGKDHNEAIEMLRAVTRVLTVPTEDNGPAPVQPAPVVQAPEPYEAPIRAPKAAPLPAVTAAPVPRSTPSRSPSGRKPIMSYGRSRAKARSDRPAEPERKAPPVETSVLATNYFKTAKGFEASNRPDRALEIYSKIVSEYPDSAEAEEAAARIKSIKAK